ncbi:hypothetical protein [Methylobacterium iners]|uniref:Uncharacterized protein n=1 Tax=Methylobacterium iners TaxID=418707 RepID=A0ABQ4RXQ3_9HYPH|nr:hypothetical protein [Methylobacterium iners]GJD95014.1 hypothetical protein OCOJLMKI_2223 [Methylobacterium iners]
MLNERPLYVSENGDTWHLVRGSTSGSVFVRHRANEASGGHVTDSAIPDFLGVERRGPEHQELWRLIAGFVEDQPEACATKR